ncbi:MAG: RNA polymerase factor sigma-54, partial [Planctomycetota bacterium]
LSLRIAPQLIQSIEILKLNTLEVQDLVRQEMLENPTIELKEERPNEGELPANDVVGADAAAGSEAASDAKAGANDDVTPELGEATFENLDAEFQRIEEMDTVWREAPGSRNRGIGPDGQDKKLEALQNTAARDDSLHVYLLSQFNLLESDERRKEIGEHLIYSLDDQTGWLGFRTEDGEFRPYSLEDLAESLELDPPAEIEEVLSVLQGIQTLEPKGIGARDLTECLLIQLGDGFPLERRMIERHLDDLMNNRLPKVAKQLDITMERLNESLAFISQLTPHPGALYSSGQTSHVVPDVICEFIDGEYEVRLEDAYVPRIHISSRYRQMLAEQRDNRAVRDYIKKKIDSAKWLIDAIEQRQSTLRRISKEIVKVQGGFFDRGIDGLAPLKMQQIADKVGVHVSTVSRAVQQKWIQTPRGIFPLRYFFNSGTTTASGEEESILAIKQKVRDIVDSENKSKPLSDEDIAKELKRMGYAIARRTVTKYRKQLAILSSRQRRQYS